MQSITNLYFYQGANTKQVDKQKITDKKKDTQKVTSQVKDVSNLIWVIVILILLVIVCYFIVKYWDKICNFVKKLKTIKWKK